MRRREKGRQAAIAQVRAALCQCCWTAPAAEYVRTHPFVRIAIDRHGTITECDKEPAATWGICADCWPLIQAGDIEGLIRHVTPLLRAVVYEHKRQSWTDEAIKYTFGARFAVAFLEERSVHCAGQADNSTVIHLQVE